MDVLVTGGAGFIGSNLCRCLAASGSHVRVLDNLSTGNLANLYGDPLARHPGRSGGIEFQTGDIREPEVLRRAVDGVEVVFHLAALPSVARSIRDPLKSHDVNASGTLNVLTAARDAGVRRVVYASSSSLYGDTEILPKHEDMPSSPLSPYAASKLAGESYCRAFANAYGLETVSLRFFNVFGPRQDPGSEYAAVIPRFTTRMLAGERPVIFGDGTNTRDFTFVANAVQACVLAAESGTAASAQAINVGCGERISLLQLIAAINELLGCDIEPEFTEPREGDVKHSLASVTKAESLLGYLPLVDVKEGLAQTIDWFAARAAVPKVS